MNLFLRLARVMLLARFRPHCSVLGPCRTPFRVALTDLDLLRHMNNGVYLSILDVARIDLMTRCGLARKLTKNGWYPVVTAETITFLRSLQLGQTFEVETSILGWDDTAFFLQQTFLRAHTPIATAVVRGRFLARTGGSLTPEQILQLLDDVPSRPALPRWVEDWSAAASTAAHAS